jgi:hypothetical protein
MRLTPPGEPSAAHPAVEYPYGKLRWYRFGELCRADGPAIVKCDGCGHDYWYRSPGRAGLRFAPLHYPQWRTDCASAGRLTISMSRVHSLFLP